MQPLFIAHLVADFLLQPTWLVQWKQKRVSGIAAHAAVHAATLLLFLFPHELKTVGIIVLIALTHGIIDFAKIRYQKTHPSGYHIPFILDQIIHLMILGGAWAVLQAITGFWKSEAGFGILTMLTFFSFGIAWFHLANIESATIKSPWKKAGRLLVVAAAFLLFIIPARLFAYSPCA